MPDLTAATGWLPHTTRAALTGLRKKGPRSSAASATIRPATASRVRNEALVTLKTGFNLDRKLAALPTLSSAELRDERRRLTRSPLPRISPSLLRLALAWEYQAHALGSLSRATIAKLDQIGRDKTKTAPALPGTQLI